MGGLDVSRLAALYPIGPAGVVVAGPAIMSVAGSTVTFLSATRGMGRVVSCELFDGLESLVPPPGPGVITDA